MRQGFARKGNAVSRTLRDPLIVDLRSWDTDRFEHVLRLFLIERAARHNMSTMELLEDVERIVAPHAPVTVVEDPSSHEITNALTRVGRLYWILSGRPSNSPRYSESLRLSEQGVDL